MNIIRITVADPDELLDAGAFGAGAGIRVEKSDVGGGSGYTALATVPLVAGTTSYTTLDQTGGSGRWYRTRYANSGGTNFSDYSAEFQAPSSVGAVATVATRSTIVPLAIATDWLGISGGANEARAERLLQAISTEIRRLTRRDLEGVPTVYDEQYETHRSSVRTGASWSPDPLWLRRVPIANVLSIRSVFWDGTEDAILPPNDVTGGVSTTLTADAAAGATTIKVGSVTGAAVGQLLRVGPAATQEVVRITGVGTAGSGGTGITVEPGLPRAQTSGDPVVEVAGSAYWRLEDADLGRLRITNPASTTRALIDAGWGDAFARGFLSPADHVRIILRTTGEIPDDIEQACLDWIGDRWSARKRGRTQSITAGRYSETFRIGPPPPDVSRVLAGYTHSTAGGPI